MPLFSGFGSTRQRPRVRWGLISHMKSLRSPELRSIPRVYCHALWPTSVLPQEVVVRCGLVDRTLWLTCLCFLCLRCLRSSGYGLGQCCRPPSCRSTQIQLHRPKLVIQSRGFDARMFGMSLGCVGMETYPHNGVVGMHLLIGRKFDGVG